jgi:hypothetical protein
MTSVFFFLAIRLGGLGGIQRESMEYQNQKAYLQSYVDYIMSLTPVQLETIKGDITFDGITGTITNEVDEIVGVLDAGESDEYKFAGTIDIEWNLCSNNHKEDIVIAGFEYTHDTATPSCSDASPGYDDSESGIVVIDPFTIEAKSAPIYYKITPVSPTQLFDNQWHLSAKIDLGYGKKIEAEEVW